MKSIISEIGKSVCDSRTHNDCWLWISLEGKNYGYEVDKEEFEKLNLTVGSEVEENILEDISSIAF